MTTRSIIKDISIIRTRGSKLHWHEGLSNGFDVLDIRHENKLTLDTITVVYHNGNFAGIVYFKPYTEKYLGLVVEWIVNNRKQIGNMIANQVVYKRIGSPR